MDGLECSIIPLQRVRNSELRFDSDYYSKRNLSLSEILSNVGNNTIGEYGGQLDCSAFYPSITRYYSNNRDSIPFLRVNEIYNGLISITDNTVFLPQHVIEENSNTIALAYPGDIIIAKGGNTLAKVGLVTNEYPVYATCRDVIILRTNRLDNLNQYYLWAFLHSSYGQRILWRSASQTGQPHLTLPSILKIKIPELSSLQSKMEILYERSIELKRTAEKSYREAENLLLRVLGFHEETKCASPIVAIKQFSESFLKSGRIDAEYYQSQYQKVENAILSYDPSSKQLSEIATHLFTGEYSEEYYNENDRSGLRQYIRGTDIGNGRIKHDHTHFVNPKLFSKIVSEGDILTGRVGTIGNFGVVDSSLHGSVCSDNVLCFHLPPKYHPNVYALYFNCGIVKSLITRLSRGSVQQRLNQETIKEVIVPFICEDVQFDIDARVIQSFMLRDESEELIGVAKQAVEIAIERGEAAALAWLKDRVNI